MKSPMLIILLLPLFFIAACNSPKAKEGIPEYFLGKELIFNPQGETVVDSLLREHDYLLVSYMDSTDCTPCSMDKFHVTQAHYKDLQEYDIAVVFIFYGTPQAEIISLLHQYHNTFAIVWDIKKEFKSDNNLLANPLYHDFIISSTRKIIWISNPFFDSHTWKYCQNALMN